MKTWTYFCSKVQRSRLELAWLIMTTFEKSEWTYESYLVKRLWRRAILLNLLLFILKLNSSVEVVLCYCSKYAYQCLLNSISIYVNSYLRLFSTCRKKSREKKVGLNPTCSTSKKVADRFYGNGSVLNFWAIDISNNR